MKQFSSMLQTIIRGCFTELHTQHFPWCDSLQFQMKQQVASCLQVPALSVLSVLAWQTGASSTDLVFSAAQWYRLHRGVIWWVNSFSAFNCPEYLLSPEVQLQAISQQKPACPWASGSVANNYILNTLPALLDKFSIHTHWSCQVLKAQSVMPLSG